MDPDKLPNSILPDFLTSPITAYTGNIKPSLSERDLSSLVQQINFYVENHSVEDLIQSNVIYWLTYALHCAVQKTNGVEVGNIVTVMHRIATQHPDAFISMLGNNIEVGIFKNQNPAYVLLSKLHLATFNLDNYKAIISISYIVSSLLNTSNKKLAEVLVQNMDIGVEEGKNAILVVFLALLQTLDDKYSHLHAESIAQLLEKMIKLDVIIQNNLTEEINRGLFKGKDILYLLVTAMSKSASDLPSVVLILCNILNEVISNNNTSQIKRSLFKPQENGSQKGLTSFQLILSSLISSAYVESDDKALLGIVAIINKLINTFPEEVNSALTKEIQFGEYSTQNGILMLIQAYVTAVDHKLDAAPILNMLMNIIDSSPRADLVEAFEHQATIQYTNRKFDSPLVLLIKQLGKNSNSLQLQELINHIDALKSSQPNNPTPSITEKKITGEPDNDASPSLLQQYSIYKPLKSSVEILESKENEHEKEESESLRYKKNK